MSIQVAVRVRPIIPRIDGRRGEVLEYDEEGSAVQLVVDVPNPGQLKAYGFDSLFGPERSTGQLYDELVRSAVQRLHEGYSLALFAYGPSGAGKTHTVTGDARSPGITTLAIRQIFSQHGPDQRCTVRASVMEIYQDVVCDLLNERVKVQLKGSGAGGVLRFQGLGEHEVHSAEQAIRMIEGGLAARTKAATYVHEHSNRSHTVVRILLETVDSGGTARLASLLLVDLAGSETVSDQQTRTAQSEGKSITRSLFHLRRCIHALAAGRRPEYRSSKLTRLLEPAIVQGGFVSIICNVGQRVLNQRQTLDCLEFGKQASLVQLAAPRQHVAEAAATASAEEFRSLQKQLYATRSNQAALEAEVRELRAKYSELQHSRRGESEEELQQIQHRLRVEQAAKAQANELLRAAEEQNQSLRSELLDLEDALSLSQSLDQSSGWTSSAAGGSPTTSLVRPHGDGTGSNGLGRSIGASEAPQQVPLVHSARSPADDGGAAWPSAAGSTAAPPYPSSPAGPVEARRAYMDAQSAEGNGDTQNALQLYQHGLRVLMKHVEVVPVDQVPLSGHVQRFFDRAFAARERLKQVHERLPTHGQGVSLSVTTAEHPGSSPRGGSTKGGVGSYFADALWMQAKAAEDNGEYKLALALLQEGIRATLAALESHPEQRVLLNSTLERLFKRAHKLRQLSSEEGKHPSGSAGEVEPLLVATTATDTTMPLARVCYNHRPSAPGDLHCAVGQLVAAQQDGEWMTCITPVNVFQLDAASGGLSASACGRAGRVPSSDVEQAFLTAKCVADFESEAEDELDLRQG